MIVFDKRPHKVSQQKPFQLLLDRGSCIKHFAAIGSSFFHSFGNFTVHRRAKRDHKMTVFVLYRIAIVNIMSIDC